MGSIFRRGTRWYLSYKNAAGKWCQAAAETEDEDAARKLLADVEELAEVQRDAGVTGPLNVRQYAKTWLARRRELFEKDGKQHRDCQGDENRVHKHVLPRIGDQLLAAVRPRHLATFVHQLRTQTDLAPHTIRNVYGLVSALFRDAAIAGHVETSPCILTKTELGDDHYVDQAAQEGDRYTREQLEQLIGSPAIADDERVFIAIGGLAGLRLGEIAGLHWGDIDETAEPLWRMRVGTTYDGRPTKTGRARVVPVHPALASLLTRWKLEGWPAMFGREPTAADVLVPRARRKGARGAGTPHTAKTGGVLMDRCLGAEGITKPAKKTHALRSTFISLAIEGDASDYLLEKVTHTTKGRSGRAFDVYAKPNWSKLCGEVAKLQINPESCLKAFGGGLQPPETADENQWRRGESNTVHDHRGDVGLLTLPAVGARPPQPIVTDLGLAPKTFVQSVDPIAERLAGALAGWCRARDVGELRRDLARLISDLEG